MQNRIKTWWDRIAAVFLSVLLVGSMWPMESISYAQEGLGSFEANDDIDDEVLLEDIEDEQVGEEDDTSQEQVSDDAGFDDDSDIASYAEEEDEPDQDAAADSDELEVIALDDDTDNPETQGQDPSEDETQPSGAEGEECDESNPTGKNYYFAMTDAADRSTSKVRVLAVTSGTVAFDSATSTLTLTDAKISGDIEADIDIKIELVGENEIRGYDSYESDWYYDDNGEDFEYDDYADGYDQDSKSIDSTSAIVLQGAGSLSIYKDLFSGMLSIPDDVTISGQWDDDSWSSASIRCTGLTMSAGTVDAFVYCQDGRVELSGGTVEYLDCSESVNMIDGTVKYGVSATTFTMSGGAVRGGIQCSGTATIKGGKLSGQIVTKNLRLYDGCSITVSYSGEWDSDEVGIECTNLTMYGGTVKLSKWGRGIDATKLTMSGGSLTIVGSEGYYYDDDGYCGIRCATLTKTGGTLSISKYDYDIKVTQSISIKDDTITFDGSIDCEDAAVTLIGATASGDIYSKSLTARGGTSITGNVYCEYGAVVFTGTTVRGRVHAKSLSVGKSTTIIARGSGSDDYSYPIECTNMAIKDGGKIQVSNHYYGIRTSGNLTITSGTITMTGLGANNYSSPIECSNFTMKAGSITVSRWGNYDWNQRISVSKKLAMTGGTINTGIRCDTDGTNGAVAFSGGTIKGKLKCRVLVMSSRAKLTYTGTGRNDYSYAIDCVRMDMRGGTVAASGCQGGICTSGNYTMSGGKVSVSNCDYGIRTQQYDNGKTANISIKGGTVNVVSPSYNGLCAYYGHIIISGGSVSVRGAYQAALNAGYTTYRGKTYGGVVKLTGGRLTATVREANNYSAVSARLMSNYPSCLATIVGELPNGARFKAAGNIYQVYDYDDAYLAQYGSSKTSFTFKDVNYGRNTYAINGVNTNAFNTTTGKKLKSLTFKNGLRYIKSKAFNRTPSLQTLTIEGNVGSINYSSTYSNGRYTYKIYEYDNKLPTDAFTGAGKNNGNGLTLKVQYDKSVLSSLRNFLQKKGLPTGTKLASTYNY